jgi:hypothetical protein
VEPSLVVIAIALWVGWGLWGWLVQRNLSRAQDLLAEVDELDRKWSERK